MKKIQAIFSDEAWAMVEAIHGKASAGFELGSISFSDVLNEMVLTSNVDLKTLQSKHIDIRRSLRAYASQEEIDVDALIRSLNELKGKSTKRKGRSGPEVKHE